MRKVYAFLIVALVALALIAYPIAARTAAAAGEQQSTSSTPAASTAAGEVSATATAGSTAATVAEALAANSATHDDAEDAAWESDTEVAIALAGDSITAEAAGVTVDGSTATIGAAGTYRLSGSLDDGQIVVDTEDEGIVRLILDGVNLSSSTSAPIYVASADEVVIVLADGTQNRVSDASEYVYPAADVDEPNAALFSTADLTITGGGALAVAGNYNDGIASKDGLVVDGGTITVTAVDDGIRGKDYLVIKDGSVTVDAGGDGLKSDNEADADKGYIAVEGGQVSVKAGGDALAAESDVLIADGVLDLVAGGGSGAAVAEDASAKGIKAAVSVVIEGGSLTSDAAEDAINTNGSLTVNGGDIAVAAGDDGLHADVALTVNDGDIRITQSYEGIESALITVNGGEIRITASDDGVNVSDGSGGETGMGMGGGRGARPGQTTASAATYTGSNYLIINGGTLVVDAAGDGLDANGAIQMTGGLVLVNGPTNSGNGALDFDGGFTLSGGVLVAAGSAGMVQAPDTASSQNSLVVNFTAVQAAGTLIHVANSAGETVLTFAPAKEFQSVVISSPDLVEGKTYTVFTGGSAGGSAADGLYVDGDYSAGSEYAAVTLSGAVTTVGNAGGWMR